MVKCDQKCDDITNKPSCGIIPRALVFEDNNSENGIIIVGINPGKISSTYNKFKHEEQEAVRKEPTYDNWERFWFKNNSRIPYYNQIRIFLKLKLHFSGSILWTEVVKCDTKSGKLPKQSTIDNCALKYLIREIGDYPEIPFEWPILAIGSPAFNSVLSKFSKRTILGIPHPNAWHGRFNHILKTELDLSMKNFLDKKIRIQINNAGKISFLDKS